MSSGLPTVSIISLGGTIAASTNTGTHATPTLGPAELIVSVPRLEEVANLRVLPFRQIPSADLTMTDIVQLAAEINQHIEDGVTGVVVTQGTDTLEETAFALDLLLDTDKPVVVTGAMRNASLPGADGPANILASVQVAASVQAHFKGVLIVFGDEIHSARYVQKTHPTKPAAFESRPVGPIGWVREGIPRLALHPQFRYLVELDTVPDRIPDVALITLSLGDTGRLLAALQDAGYSGLVVETLGGGHVPSVLVEKLEAIACEIPTVYTSRTRGGEVLRSSYGFPGSETDLLRRGLIPAGSLDGPKARILLTLLLAASVARDEIVRAFNDID